MKRSRLNIVWIGLLLCVLALSLAPMLATAAKTNAKAMTLTLSITSKGIMESPKMPMGGDYTVIVKNDTKGARGLEIVGIDRGGTAYVRYTKVLQPGGREKFKWFFLSGDTVHFRDLTRCEHAENSCVIATFGQMHRAIKFR